jgi:hypothetical protein
MTKQKAENINNSDVTQVAGNQYNTGYKADEVTNMMTSLISNLKSVIQDVVRNELNERSEKARQTSKDRTLEYGEAVTEQLSDPSNKELLEKFDRPDIQRSLRLSLIQFIDRGDEETKEAMVDLLIDRLHADGNNIEQAVIDEAIEILPRLSKSSTTFLSLLYCRSLVSGGNTLNVFLHFSIIGNMWVHLQELSQLDIAYLRQLSCCVNVSGLNHYFPLERILSNHYDYMFRDYGYLDNIMDIINNNPFLNMQFGHDFSFIKDGVSNRLFFTCPNEKSLKENLQAYGYSDREQVVKDYISSLPTLPPEEIRKILIAHNINWQLAFDVLNRDLVQKQELTPLGMYIAKKTIKKLVGLSTPELEKSFSQL